MIWNSNFNMSNLFYSEEQFSNLILIKEIREFLYKEGQKIEPTINPADGETEEECLFRLEQYVEASMDPLSIAVRKLEFKNRALCSHLLFYKQTLHKEWPKMAREQSRRVIETSNALTSLNKLYQPSLSWDEFVDKVNQAKGALQVHQKSLSKCFETIAQITLEMTN